MTMILHVAIAFFLILNGMFASAAGEAGKESAGAAVGESIAQIVDRYNRAGAVRVEGVLLARLSAPTPMTQEKEFAFRLSRQGGSSLRWVDKIQGKAFLTNEIQWAASDSAASWISAKTNLFPDYKAALSAAAGVSLGLTTTLPRLFFDGTMPLIAATATRTNLSGAVARPALAGLNEKGSKVTIVLGEQPGQIQEIKITQASAGLSESAASKPGQAPAPAAIASFEISTEFKSTKFD